MTTKNDIERLFRNNYRAMHSLASYLLCDADAACDIVHDVFCGLLSADVADITTAYLMRSVRNRCLNRLRDMSTHQRLHAQLAIELQDVDDEQWPDDATIVKIRTTVDRLPEQCRRVVNMRFIDGLSYRQIAAVLSISEVMVYKHLRHAIDVIRLNLKRNGQD